MAQPSKDSKKKDANNATSILHHVGMVVNGFEIIKLIGKIIIVNLVELIYRHYILLIQIILIKIILKYLNYLLYQILICIFSH